MSRKGFVSLEANTVFFWSQKAACSTLFRLLVQNFGRDAHYYNANSVPWNEAIAQKKRRGLKSAVVVRDPTARVVSAYLNKFVSYQGRDVTVENMESFSLKLHRQYCTLYRTDPHQNSMTFETFLRIVKVLHDERFDKNKNLVNGHWDTQIPPGMTRHSYDIVARVENFPEDLERLCRETGLKPKISRANKTIMSRKETGYLGHLPPYELQKREFSTSSFLSPETAQLIQDIYRIDFEFLGYHLPELRRITSPRLAM